MDDKREYWVIEFIGEYPRHPGQVNYVCMRDVEDPTKQGFMDWTTDIREAMQFARQQDGLLFAKMYFWADWPECIAVREHVDVTIW